VTFGEPRGGGWWRPVLLIGGAFTAIAAAVVATQRVLTRARAESEAPAVALLAAPAESIAAEAQVFRTRAGMMAIAFTARRVREAHPRTLKTMRYLRAYPGAPPRIPHELTPDEFRTEACMACHARGGYSRRFTAYVPVTPHPGASQCLQCHVGADEVMAVSLLSSDPNRRCRQCHGVGGGPRAGAGTSPGWRAAAWPHLAPRTPGRPPPEIPHDLQSRGNCLACHAGPAAVSEVRTTHAERADCRQCHVVPDPEAGVFTRAASAGGDGTGDAP
jgi:nitrate reductase (cytochrome), electron transfer subunit